MALKNPNPPQRTEESKLKTLTKDFFREIHRKMQWIRDNPDPREQKLWLTLVILYCENRIRHLNGEK